MEKKKKMRQRRREKRGEERKKGREEGERSEKRREKEKAKSGAKGAPPSENAFPSMKLGNNMTPIKGRLRKNTTPTCRRTAALTPNLQKDPQQRRKGFCYSSYPVSVAHQRKRSIQSISPTAMKPLFIRKSKPSETSANVPNSPSISN